ncbi:MAG TPA: hypothetical protein VNO52_08260, partial [Methylomirabilota bacterium]|nr:hypothetical protein [Methylomirabilota bacterium]
MPNEPENRTDELLRQYARQRRQAAEALRPLHAATRRLLQREVAHVRATAPVRPRLSWRSFVSLWWPRLAFPAGALVITGLAVWMLIVQTEPRQMAQAPQPPPADAVADEKAETLAVVETASMPAAPAPASQPTPTHDATPAEDTAIRGATAVAEATGNSARKLQRLDDAAVARRPDRPGEMEKQDANAPLVVLKAAEEDALGRRTEGESVVAPPVVAAEQTRLNLAASPPTSLAAQAASWDTNQARLLAEQRGRFRRIAPADRAQEPARRPARADVAQGQQVLNSFEFIQTDTHVEIRDGDGSVYSGAVLSRNGVAASGLSAAEAKPQGLAREALRQEVRAQAGADRGAVVPVFFRVQGTNRSLNQTVVLDGQILPAIARTGSAGAGPTSPLPLAAAAAGAEVTVQQEDRFQPAAPAAVGRVTNRI